MNFSVLISVYSKELPSHLALALESILINQTVLPNEIVIVKDGLLPQDLNNILDNYKKNYPTIVKIYGYDQNKGLGFALNYGLKECIHELVFRMDSDDIAHSNRFEKQIEIFNKYQGEITIVGSNIEEFNNVPGDLKMFRNVPTSPQKIEKNKFYRNPFNHMTVAFFKSAIINSGGYKSMPGYEDYYLWLRVLKNFKGINLKESLVFARVGNGMITRRQGFSFFVKEYNFQKTLLKENLISTKIFRKNIVYRIFPRLFPVFLLKIIYNKFLRK
jgi:glycosyltransferase involved in cell wall biosynthesis